jgi:hypothetical protein
MLPSTWQGFQNKGQPNFLAYKNRSALLRITQFAKQPPFGVSGVVTWLSFLNIQIMIPATATATTIRIHQ